MTVWANDTNNNFDFIGPVSFTIQDTTLPVLANLVADPALADVSDPVVNITVDATDLYGIASIIVNVTYPDLSFNDFIMLLDASGSY